MSVELKFSHINFDFTGYEPGTVTRHGYHIEACPECDKPGERKQKQNGRRRVTYVHRTRTQRYPDGTLGNPEHLEACKAWEVNDTKQAAFPGWVDYRYPKDGDS